MLRSVPRINRNSKLLLWKLGCGFARDLGTVTCVRVCKAKLIGFFKKANSHADFFKTTSMSAIFLFRVAPISVLFEIVLFL
jgi:hypothetical protein